MKLLALCVVGALAAQDTAPPILSLSLDGQELAGNGNNPNPALGHHARHMQSKHNNAGRSNGFTRDGLTAACEVGNSSRDKELCPEPTCKAIDHHDVHCKDESKCKDMNGKELAAFCQQGDAKNPQLNPACTHEFECDKPIYMLENEDGHNYDASDMQTFDRLHREVRSQWIIKYGASDRSGNAAESVSFVMVFRDTLAPVLATEFGTSNMWESVSNHVSTFVERAQCDAGEKGWDCNANTHAPSDTPEQTLPSGTAGVLPWAESCTLNGNSQDSADAESASRGTAPCKYVLPTSSLKTSIDRYDGDVTEDVTFCLKYKTPCSSVAASFAKMSATTEAARTIDTHQLGIWYAEFITCDKAGDFGYDQKNNCGTQRVAIEVTDNVRPKMARRPYTADTVGKSGVDDATVTIECDSSQSAYVDPKARCFDLRNTWQVSGYVDEIIAENPNSLAVDGTKIYNTDAKNSHVVTYDCDDGLGNNSADAADRDESGPEKHGLYRTVIVQDNTPPVLTLKGDHQIQTSAGKVSYLQNSAGADMAHEWANKGHNFEKSTGLDMSEDGLGCHSVAQQAAGTHGCGGALCTDTCDTTPTITATLYGSKDCTGPKFCAEEGCAVPGALSEFPEFVAGDYSIEYVCSDGTAGDERAQLTATRCRYIDNVDHTRPIIQVLGADEMTLEATHEGNYVDDGATCFDQVDGVISQNVEVSGDVVNLSKIGTYHIVYNCKDSAGNTADEAERVVHIAQTSCPECTINGCEVSLAKPRDQRTCTQKHEASFAYVDASAQCSDDIDGKIRNTDDLDFTNPVNVDMTGTYIVTYRARNSAGLWSDGPHCKNRDTEVGRNLYFRTVVVIDTLKPVVEVSYNGQKVARGEAKDTAVHNGAENPMGTTVCKVEAKCGSLTGDALQTYCVTNPDDCNDDGWTPEALMAENASASSRTWPFAGLAAAVTGIALLSFGSRRREAVVTVPV